MATHTLQTDPKKLDWSTTTRGGQKAEQVASWKGKDTAFEGFAWNGCCADLRIRSVRVDLMCICYMYACIEQDHDRQEYNQHGHLK